MMIDADLSTAQHAVMLAMMASALAIPAVILAHTALVSGRGHAFGPPLPGRCPPAGSGRRPAVPPSVGCRPLLLFVALALTLVLAGCSDTDLRRQALTLVTGLVVTGLFAAMAAAVAFAMRPRRDGMNEPFGDVPRAPDDGWPS